MWQHSAKELFYTMVKEAVSRDMHEALSNVTPPPPFFLNSESVKPIEEFIFE